MSYTFLTLIATVAGQYVRFPDDQQIATINGYIDLLLDWSGPGYEQRGRDWPGICATGRQQSPIDITPFVVSPGRYQEVTADNSTFRPIQFENEPSPVIVQYNGKFETNWLYSGTLTQQINDVSVEQILASVIFEAPAEYTLNGVRFPMGIYLAYAGALPTGAITFGYQVYVWVREGQRNLGLDQYINQQPLDVSYFLPPGGLLTDYYFYTGSFDISPCPESVPWVVSNYIIEAAPDQIAYFTAQYVTDLSFSGGNGNIRTEQPLYDRTLYHFFGPSQ